MPILVLTRRANTKMRNIYVAWWITINTLKSLFNIPDEIRFCPVDRSNFEKSNQFSFYERIIRVTSALFNRKLRFRVELLQNIQQNVWLDARRFILKYYFTIRVFLFLVCRLLRYMYSQFIRVTIRYAFRSYSFVHRFCGYPRIWIFGFFRIPRFVFIFVSFFISYDYVRRSNIHNYIFPIRRFRLSSQVNDRVTWPLHGQVHGQ